MPSTRTFGDADVFVVPENLPRALAIMTANGWRENAASRQPRRYFYRWCRESVNLERRSGESVDVHHRPSPWIWSRGLPVDTMIRRATAHEVGEHALLFADLADNALVSALQLITDHRDPGGKLLAWRDLRELGARDPVAVARRANDVGLGGVLRALVGGMPAPLRPGGLDDLLDGHIAHPRRIVSLLEAARRGAFLHAHVARLPALNAALYLGGTAAPSRAFLQERYGSDRAPLTTWWRDLRSWPDGNATAAHPNAGGPVAAPGAR